MKSNIFGRLTMLFLLAVASLPALAEMNGVRITSTEGKSVTLSFESQPNVVFDNENVTVSSAEATVEFPVTSDITFDFVEVSAISETEVNESSISIEGTTILLGGLRADSDVMVYDLSGKLLICSRCNHEGNCTLDASGITGLPVIVKTSEKTFKIIIR